MGLVEIFLYVDISKRIHVGYMITGNCTFLGSAKYPDIYLVGLGIHKIGNTSLHYKLALFPTIRVCFFTFLFFKSKIRL